MTREQLDLLIKYINLKVQLSNSYSPAESNRIRDKLADTLRELEDSCEG